MFVSPGTRIGRGRVNSGSFNSGTSFPVPWPVSTPFYRTDLNQWFFFDGTNWLSSQISRYVGRWTPSTYLVATAATQADGLREGVPYFNGCSDLWLMNYHVQFLVGGGGTALGAGQSWSVSIHKYDTNIAATTIATANINSGASSVIRVIDTTVNALLGGTTYLWFGTTLTKAGTPGTLQVMEELTYRYVAV